MKERFWGEVRSAPPAAEKGLVAWTENPTRHDMPFSPSLTQSKVLTLQLLKAKRGQETADENFEASRAWFMKFSERSHLRNIKMQSEAAGANREAVQVIQKIWLR